MQIKLVSDDSDLCKLCAEIVTEIARDRPCSFSTASIESLRENPGDLNILDFELKAPLSEGIDWNCSNLIVLAHRRDLAEVKKLIGFEANVVLKPATRSTLSAFLCFAISNHTASSVRDDRDQIFQCLIEANLKLQEYDQSRTNFLTRVVHDFRAPLTALSGYCGLLLGEPLGPLNDNQREVIRRMQYSAKRLVRMSSAMLQLSVSRQLKKHPNLQEGDLVERFDQALHEIGPFADDKRIAIKSTLAPCDRGLYFESEQIDQVLINILDNACKFTPRNGLIEIHGYPFFWERRGRKAVSALPRERRVHDIRDPNSYRVDICNSGSALAREHLESIFEEYTSYSGGSDRSGGGLGLAICKMIIAQHSGHVWAENTDAGPMFSFVLPIRRSGSAQRVQPVLSA